MTMMKEQFNYPHTRSRIKAFGACFSSDGVPQAFKDSANEKVGILNNMLDNLIEAERKIINRDQSFISNIAKVQLMNARLDNDIPLDSKEERTLSKAFSDWVTEEYEKIYGKKPRR